MIFGAGEGTTATRSLRAALEMLGLGGWHYAKERGWTRALLSTVGFEDLSRTWDEEQKRHCHEKLRTFEHTFPAEVEFVMDSPAAWVFLQLFRQYPRAKFILTVREPRDWAHSRNRHHPKDMAPMQEPC